jgi:dTDP-4-amino-4,6-dideoxygalactose transaminase
LKLIYDAAHAFGVRSKGAPLAAAGDLSVLSFHATKVFNTFEGGAIICRDGRMKQRIDYLKNFGIADEVTVVGIGINGKMNEFQAALGLVQLRHVEAEREKRRAVEVYYRERLADVEGLRLLGRPPEVESNFSYFPLLIGEGYGRTRDEIHDLLRARGVFARRYFYPLMSELPTYRDLPSAAADNLPVATRIAREILCLPIHSGLGSGDLERVVSIIRNRA